MIFEDVKFKKIEIQNLGPNIITGGKQLGSPFGAPCGGHYLDCHKQNPNQTEPGPRPKPEHPCQMLETFCFSRISKSQENGVNQNRCEACPLAKNQNATGKLAQRDPN